jgi:transposase
LVGEKIKIEAKKERCMSIDLGVENMATLVQTQELLLFFLKAAK